MFTVLGKQHGSINRHGSPHVSHIGSAAKALLLSAPKPTLVKH